MFKTRWHVAICGLVLVIALTWVASLSRGVPRDRCAFDGGSIEPLFGVVVTDEQRQRHEFCCVRCAETWLRRSKIAPRSVFVTDEVSGQAIDANSAYFVRSMVVTNRSTGNRCHVFRRAADAESHRLANRGRLLTGSEKPFLQVAKDGD